MNKPLVKALKELELLQKNGSIFKSRETLLDQVLLGMQTFGNLYQNILMIVLAKKIIVSMQMHHCSFIQEKQLSLNKSSLLQDWAQQQQLSTYHSVHH